MDWPLRSLLFVPAHRTDFVEKAARFQPDAVILDIEDAVPPGQKSAARALVPAAAKLLRAAGIVPTVRINALREGGHEDVAAAACEGMAAVILPKADSTAEIAELHDLLSYHEGRAGLPHGGIAILPLAETAPGLRHGYDLAKASPRVRGLFGSIGGPAVAGDVARAFGFLPTLGGEEQRYMNSKVVLDSRAAGAPFPVAGIIGTAIDDLPSVEAMIRRAKETGYTGACLIHPSHVEIANRVFRPTTEELAYCQGMLAAFAEAEAKGLGAVRYRGSMVDYAMLPPARAVIEEAARLAARGIRI
jgi:citrate lyase subunit beta/citryl-CoA lyase